MTGESHPSETRRGDARPGASGRGAPCFALLRRTLATLATLAAATAVAQTGEVSGCQEQARRLCSNLSSETARDRCMLQRELECESSGPTHVIRERIKDPSAGMRNACRADFGKVCAELGNDASKTAILRCLREHRDEVSDPCRMALALEAEETRRPDGDACRTQIREACPGSLGRDALRECLRTEGPSLDEECRRALARRLAGSDVHQPQRAPGRHQP